MKRNEKLKELINDLDSFRDFFCEKDAELLQELVAPFRRHIGMNESIERRMRCLSSLREDYDDADREQYIKWHIDDLEDAIIAELPEIRNAIFSGVEHIGEAYLGFDTRSGDMRDFREFIFNLVFFADTSEDADFKLDQERFRQTGDYSHAIKPSTYWKILHLVDGEGYEEKLSSSDKKKLDAHHRKSCYSSYDAYGSLAPEIEQLLHRINSMIESLVKGGWCQAIPNEKTKFCREAINVIIDYIVSETQSTAFKDDFKTDSELKDTDLDTANAVSDIFVEYYKKERK